MTREEVRRKLLARADSWRRQSISAAADGMDLASAGFNGRADAYGRAAKLVGLIDSFEQDLDPDALTVCSAHLRFIPCRHGSEDSPCWYSQEPADVDATKRYQWGDR